MKNSEMISFMLDRMSASHKNMAGDFSVIEALDDNGECDLHDHRVIARKILSDLSIIIERLQEING